MTERRTKASRTWVKLKTSLVNIFPNWKIWTIFQDVPSIWEIFTSVVYIATPSSLSAPDWFRLLTPLPYLLMILGCRPLLPLFSDDPSPSPPPIWCLVPGKSKHVASLFDTAIYLLNDNKPITLSPFGLLQYILKLLFVTLRPSLWCNTFIGLYMVDGLKSVLEID